jgi:hypothetical protein
MIQMLQEAKMIFSMKKGAFSLFLYQIKLQGVISALFFVGKRNPGILQQRGTPKIDASEFLHEYIQE